LTAIAYDTSNNQAQNSISINVQNTVYPSSIYVNSGGNTVSYQNVSWQKDVGFSTPSSVISSTLSFANPIYRTAREGSFNYQFAVANGTQNVTLKFAELVYKKTGQRVFNVTINGVSAIANLDLYKSAGYGVTYDRTFLVNVTNNQLQINFIPVIGQAQINGIEIIKQ
jgi:hypothetical protein